MSQTAVAQYYEVNRNASDEICTLSYYGDAELLSGLVIDGTAVESIPSLTRVRLNHHDITKEELDFLASISTLHALEIGDLPEEVELSNSEALRIGAMKGLRELRMAEAGLAPESFRFLAQLKALEKLSIEYDFTDTSAHYLSDLSNLHTIDLGGDFSEKTVKAISELPMVSKVSLFSNLITDQAVVHLSELDGLRQLTLSRGKLTPSVFAFVGSLGRLERLSLCTDGRSDQISPLGDLANLRYLSLHTTSELPFSITSKMAKLEALRIEGHQPADNFESILSHPSLKEVQFPQTRVDFAGAQALATIPNLKTIIVSKETIANVKTLLVSSMPRVRLFFR